MEDTLRKAVLKAGKFDACYFDRGSQYIAKQLNLSLSRLGITVRLAPRASGQSKGKVEKFHQVVDMYLREAKAHQIRTLEQLNQYWGISSKSTTTRSPMKGSVSTMKVWAALNFEYEITLKPGRLLQRDRHRQGGGGHFPEGIPSPGGDSYRKTASRRRIILKSR